MSNKLYIGNLPFNAEESALRELFETSGATVGSVQIITDRETGRSRGFGFVELDSPDQVEAAIESVNGKELMGRALIVNEAREQTKRGPRTGGRDGGGFGGGRSSFGGGGNSGYGGGGGKGRSSRW